MLCFNTIKAPSPIQLPNSGFIKPNFFVSTYLPTCSTAIISSAAEGSSNPVLHANKAFLKRTAIQKDASGSLQHIKTNHLILRRAMRNGHQRRIWQVAVYNYGQPRVRTIASRLGISVRSALKTLRLREMEATPTC